MKTLAPIMFVICILSIGCETSQSLFNKGEYDAAMEKALKRLESNHNNQQQIIILEKSYKNAQQKDLDHILFLKKEGKPERWDEIYTTCLRVSARQERLRKLPDLIVRDKKGKILRTVVFELNNYDTEIQDAKQQAADYYYTHAISLLDQGGRQNGRNASIELQKVKDYFPTYKDVDKQLDRADEAGAIFILYKMFNQSNVYISPEVENQLSNPDLNDENIKWIKYFTLDDTTKQFDFSVTLKVSRIEVAPASERQYQTTETREIQDGWKNVYDSHGNVMKDSSGNEMKTPLFKIISCNVTETVQKKSTHITGIVEYYNSKGQLIGSIPLQAGTKFEHHSIITDGDINALSPESQKLLGSAPVPIPGDQDIILRAAGNLAYKIKAVLKDNQNLLQ